MILASITWIKIPDKNIFIGQDYKVENPEGSRYWYASFKGRDILLNNGQKCEFAMCACVEHLRRSLSH